MSVPNHYLYLRGLRQVDHTVFCVADGQKTYYDPIFGFKVPYSSGQQVKHSILDQLSDDLGEPRAPVIFNWKLSKKDNKQVMGEGEVWSACNPKFVDQLIGGWMKASKDASQGVTIKRRSPLSISAMRPLHPTLSGLAKETGTFDRSNAPEQHKIRVTNELGVEVSHEDFLKFLQDNSRNGPLRKYLPEDQMGQRAAGLFVYDVAIDLRTLFSVSLNTFDPELATSTVTELRDGGWVENSKRNCLICPAETRKNIIPALVNALIYWRITSNQSRTYSPQNTLAIAVSKNANRLSEAIRADLSEESNYKRAVPILAGSEETPVYITVTAKGYIPDADASDNALEAAGNHLIKELTAYDYET